MCSLPWWSLGQLPRGLEAEIGDDPGEAVLGTVEGVLEAGWPGIRLRPQRLQGAGRPQGTWHPRREPLLHQPLVVLGELAVLHERAEAGLGPAQVALGVVVLPGAHDGGCHEVAVARGRLHDQPAANSSPISGSKTTLV